jgi:2-oxoglutarate dehydrogenase E2 component (dihydrolipoamide succinyltransferase)
MKINIVMPKMGESITEGTIIKWHKKKGDAVKKDEIIYEISTDKVDTEIPSPADGVLADIKVFEQETVPVDTIVAVLETEKDALPGEEAAAEILSTTQVGGDIVEIPMPKMGESIMEGTIIKWHKKVGDTVKPDEIIFEISTDKVDTEVPSSVEGIITEILCGEQQTVPVGFVVAKIKITTGLRKGEKAEVKPAEMEPVNANPVHAPAAVEKKEIQPVNEDRFYSPLVMSIARKENVGFDELRSIRGSGLNGRLTKKDLLDYLDKRKPGIDISQPVSAEPKTMTVQNEKSNQLPESGGVQIIPMDNIRQKIMQHMIKSKETSVHVTAILEVDVTKIYNFINQNRDSLQKNENIKLTYLPFISYAVVKALREFPLMNASVEGNNILQKKYINLGIAVAVEPNGLIVPNIKNADEKNIKGLAKAIAELGYKARNKKLSTDDVVNGTFSITNYGVFGSLFGTPIINQPEVGILGVGSVTKRPVVIEVEGNDVIAVKPMMYLSLSHDHRLVDGMLGGRFLKSIKDTLENFDVSMV